jgi:hypothetical protein
MPERIAWTERLQQIAKAALLGIIGLAVGLVAIFFTLSVLWTIFVLGRLLGAELGLWEWELSFGLIGE